MTITNPPDEFLEWTLLQRLPQYTLAELDELPAYKIERYLALIEAQAREEARARAR